ncbi:GNAT family N-acetyltransferase [Sporosarcina limicola]|uniref:Ribosomal protein S18 acetylase RimI-like enzyme n=1 Tax=Sporosarcina limicola TaxID=34101 RepID=A0A927R3X9_9BACL|nr:GNAT family N-acetyltransferase [Sporosarcina limicola]MBE1554253.1 ribosomal protein S18 acetylase RimI-like enzyme [Sporosarcina limicola]
MLTKEQLAAIKMLQKECEQADDIQLKLNWDMLRQRDDQCMDFFQWEGEELVAYLALYEFGSSVEVCGMVKPSERRNHHFSKLWQEALKMIEEKGFQKVLFNAPASSESAKSWLVKQPCQYDFSEFHMQWEERPLEESSDIILRKSLAGDYDLEIKLDVLAFDFTEEDARNHHEQVKGRPGEHHYIIEVNKESIGKLRVHRDEQKAYIYGFSILPNFQGQGYGRKALRNIVKQEHEAGYSIQLDVETKNDNALHLYESVGFVTIQGQDYYLSRINGQ